MSKKHKKNVCRVLNYIEHLLILISTIIGCVSINSFASLASISIGIMSSAIGLEICVITAWIRKWKSIIKKKKTEHDKIVLLAKSKLNSTEALIFKALINSNISHDEFVLINEVLEEFYNIKEEIENFNDKEKFKLYIKQCYLIVWSIEKIQKVKSKSCKV